MTRDDPFGRSRITRVLGWLSAVCLAIGFGGLLVLPSVNVSVEHSLIAVLGYDGSSGLPYVVTVGAWTLAIVTHVLARRIDDAGGARR